MSNINLLAFFFPIILFFYFITVGYATLYCLYHRQHILQNLLIAPTMGIIVTLIPIFWLNRYGYPVKTFAIPLTLFLFLWALILLLMLRAEILIKKYIPFLCIFLLALFLIGRPLLFFGFDWLSYANDDMANYCLGALHFLKRGYTDTPVLENLIANKDLSQYYWFAFVPGMIRSGSELLLAWTSALTHLNPAHIFMPLNITYYLSLISASGALVLHNKKYRAAALLTCLLVMCSALTTLGVLYELIAQVLGLSLLLISTLLFFRIINNSKSPIPISLVLGLTLSALLIVYPEVVPILGLGLIFYAIGSVLKKRKLSENFYKIILFCAIVTFIILNKYCLNILVFLQYQASQGATDYKGALFPYFLIPSGIANLWGMQTLAALSNEPWLSITILLSLMLTVVSLIFLRKQLRSMFPAAVMTVVFIALTVYMALKLKLNSGFSLFKLAMYIQPFLLAVLAVGLLNLRYKYLSLFIGISLILVNLYTQNNYVNYSYGNLGTPFTELPNGSNTHLLSELDRLKLSDNMLVIDTPSIVGSKLLALNSADNSIQFISHTFFDKFLFTGSKLFRQYQTDAFHRAELLATHAKQSEEILSFNFGPSKINSFSKRLNETQDNQYLIMESPLRNIFNRYQLGNIHDKNYVISPIAHVKNHLIFVNSKLGQYYYFGEAPNISLYNLENDYFYPQDSMAAIGRYLLFRIINPENRIRLSITMTTTLNHDGDNRLPKSTLIGDKHYSLPFTGRGSAHIFSSAFNPQIIQNFPYLMLDMQHSKKVVSTPRMGLMQLYGKNISLDPRSIVGYVRDISLIDDMNYMNISPPSYLSEFPKDLRNQNLEYSGIYEDGWISEDAFFILHQPKTKHELTIKGKLPNLSKNILSISIDNKLIKSQFIKDENFIVRCKTSPSFKHKIQLRFSQVQSLSQDDPRPAAAKIEFIGFT